MKHLEEQEKDQIVVQLLSTEGVKTAEIEGELLNQDSVQSSIRRTLGLSTVKRNVQHDDSCGPLDYGGALKRFLSPPSHEAMVESLRLM